jgi:hypothetical protein
MGLLYRRFNHLTLTSDSLLNLRAAADIFFTRRTVGDSGVPFGEEEGDLTLDGMSPDQNLFPLRRWEGDRKLPQFPPDMTACNDSENICTVYTAY